MSGVTFTSVTAAYGQTPVLRDVSLALTAGQTHVVLGPSGSGKSILLRCLTGLLTPVSGTIEVFGTAVPQGGDTQRTINRETGLVTQDGGLFPHMTVAENIMLPGKLAGWPAARQQARLVELESFVDLSPELRTRFPRALSGGQRQRVSLARALLLNPPLLLLDEPLSALDPMTRGELQDQLKAVFAALRKTVIIVTHDIPEALHFADSIALIEGGRVVQHDVPERILQAPASEWARSFLRSSIPRWREAVRQLKAIEE